MKNSLLDNIYIIHVSEGYEDRKLHIDKHLPERGLSNFEYILQGDIKDITPFIAENYFTKNLKPAEISCSYKHILVYKKMVDERIEKSLILEDDAFLETNAVELINRIEYEMRHEKNYIINIEKSNYSVPWIFKRHNKFCYLASHTKRCGGYIIHLDVAEKIVRYLDVEKIDLPIDSFQTKNRDTLCYNTYWLDPAIVTQGSKNGSFASELSRRKTSKFKKLTSTLRDFYQRFIVTNFSKKRLESFKNVIYHKD